MLLEMDVRNYALIEHISIQFGDGFNVLTGETGAGKSLIISHMAPSLTCEGFVG